MSERIRSLENTGRLAQACAEARSYAEDVAHRISALTNHTPQSLALLGHETVEIIFEKGLSVEIALRAAKHRIYQIVSGIAGARDKTILEGLSEPPSVPLGVSTLVNPEWSRRPRYR